MSDVFITIRIRGRLPEGRCAETEAKYLAVALKRVLNHEDIIPTELEVIDAWPQTVRDDRPKAKVQPANVRSSKYTLHQLLAESETK